MNNYIFDIDGTLLHTNYAGKKAFKEAFEITFNVNIPENFFGLSFLGGVDLNIYKKLLEIFKIEYKDPDKFIFNYENLLKQKYNSKINNWDYSSLLEELLKKLKTNGHILSISTGNFYKTAILKLSEISILKYFDYIGACENETERKDILLKSISYSFIFGIKKSNIFYIGDAISDQEAANFFNIKFIGIGSNIDKNLLKPDDLHFNSIDDFYKNITFANL
ncbi:MAG: HAD family hydrolase [Spirochaetes bacterium]|nr:HAD family hydrolase [Spirochaetota bacterium]